MKTNRFLYAMAAAAMMAACSQEDMLELNNTSSVDLSNRVTIGNIELGCAQATRGSLNENHGYAETYKQGDAIGAVLIDKLSGNSAKADKKQTVTIDGVDVTIENDNEVNYAQYIAGFNVKKASDYYAVTDGEIWTNYEYKHSGSGFNTEATLVEGNYLFYSPFNGKVQTRTAMKVVFPMVQDCSADAASKRSTSYMGNTVDAYGKALSDLYSGNTAGYEDAISSIGYQFLAKRSPKIKPNVSMNYLYATPMITIKNNFRGYLVGSSDGSLTEFAGGDIEIEKVLIYDNDDATNNIIFKTASLVNTAVDDINGSWAAANVLSGNSSAYTSSVLDGLTKGYDAWNNNLNQPKNQNAQITNPANGNFITCNVNTVIPAGKEYHFHMVLPAANYGHSLTALVYAKINGTRYVMSEGVTIGKDNRGNKNLSNGGVKAHAFRDKSHGDQNAILLRGHNVPAAELKVYEDSLSADKKAFAGQMMTIDLNGSIPGNGSSWDNYVAYELNVVQNTYDYGLETNQQFIVYMSDYVQRGVNIEEDNSTTGIRTRSDYNNWEQKVAFNLTQCAIEINGTLVEAMKQWMELDANNGNMITLDTNLPIDNTVSVSDPVNGNEYTFTSVASNKTYQIKFKQVNTSLAGSNKLKSGITTLGGGGTIAGANAKAVVFLTSGTWNINGSSNISEIHAASGVTLNVNTSLANTRVIANRAKIIVGTNGTLAFSGNSFNSCTITNDNLKEINGSMNNASTTVIVNRGAWPTTNIPGNSRINKIVISAAANTILTVDQAQVDRLAQLSNGNITVALNDGVIGIQSSANVQLSKIGKIENNTGAGIVWTSTELPLTISGNAQNDWTTFTNITMGEVVTTRWIN